MPVIQTAFGHYMGSEGERAPLVEELEKIRKVMEKKKNAQPLHQAGR